MSPSSMAAITESLFAKRIDDELWLDTDVAVSGVCGLGRSATSSCTSRVLTRGAPHDAAEVAGCSSQNAITGSF